MDGTFKVKAIEMRKEGKTYSEILAIIPVAKSTLSIWLKDVGLSKPQQQQITEKRKAAQIKGAAARRTTRIKEVDILLAAGISDIGEINDRELFLIGIALYWGEGNKQKLHNVSQGVAFANSDYRMVKVFIAWLDLIGIEKESRVYELYVHVNRYVEAKEFKAWWSEKLDIPQLEYRVYTKQGNRKTNRYNTKDLYHGLLRIRVKSSTALNRRIDGWISGITRHINIAGSSNGRTSDFDSDYLGSTPSPAAKNQSVAKSC
jgi:PAS domain-containing protein